MRPTGIVLHLPKPQLIPAVLGVSKTNMIEQLFFVGSVATLDEAITPGHAFLNQTVNPSAAFDRFGEAGFALRMSRVLHRKTHGVVRESDKKGG